MLTLLLLCSTLPLLATTYYWAGGNGDWEVSANWIPNGVPNGEDIVKISTGTVYLNSAKSAIHIHIESAATLEIESSGNLRVNLRRGTFVNIDGNLFNGGFLSVLGHQDGTATYAVENDGNLLNDGTVKIISASNQSLFCGAASSLVNNARFLIEFGGGYEAMRTDGMVVNKGEMTILDVDDHGWQVAGTLFNYGWIRIDGLSDIGLKNQGEIDNYSEISINSDAVYTFFNYLGGELVNHQEAEITLEGAAMHNDLSCSVFNYGVLKLSDSGTLGIRNYGIFTNFRSGSIEIDGYEDLGIMNWLSALFKNRGDILVGPAPNAAKGLHNRAVFRNLASGKLRIKDTGPLAIQNEDGIILNKGGLYLIDIGGDGIANEGSSIFRNWNGGSLQMQGVTGISIDNYQAAIFDNSDAALECAVGGDFSIYNRGDFRNRRCGEVRCPEIIGNRSGADFINSAWLLTSYHGQHFNQTGGNITNNGVIEDLHGAFDGVQLTNNGIIVGPIADPAYVGQVVPDILGLGSLSNATIVGWWVDEQGNIPAGSYNPADNAFTPNGNAANTTTLYVEIDLSVDKNCRPQMIAINFLQGIQHYHALVKEANAVAASHMKVYPNPCPGYCQVEIELEEPGYGTLALYHANGQLVWQQAVYVDAPTTFPVGAARLATGAYWLRWQTDQGETLTKPVVVTP